jgi:hypothetical protein
MISYSREVHAEKRVAIHSNVGSSSAQSDSPADHATSR